MRHDKLLRALRASRVTAADVPDFVTAICTKFRGRPTVRSGTDASVRFDDPVDHKVFATALLKIIKDAGGDRIKGGGAMWDTYISADDAYVYEFKVNQLRVSAHLYESDRELELEYR